MCLGGRIERMGFKRMREGAKIEEEWREEEGREREKGRRNSGWRRLIKRLRVEEEKGRNHKKGKTEQKEGMDGIEEEEDKRKR